MSEVKRYVTTCDCMRPASWGDYVRHDDYAALRAENERLRDDYSEACDDAMAVARKLRATEVELAALRQPVADEREAFDLWLPDFGEGSEDIAARKGWEAGVEWARAALSAPAAGQDVSALVRDAGRYRWLRQRLVGASFDWDDEGMAVLVFEMPDGVSIGADCDKNIDAALAAHKAGGGQL